MNFDDNGKTELDAELDLLEQEELDEKLLDVRSPPSYICITCVSVCEYPMWGVAG